MFHGELTLHPRGRKLFEVHNHDGSWYCETRGIVIRVEDGFVTDFASFRWWMRPVFPPTGTPAWPYGEPAVLHDWLYYWGAIHGRPITRKCADVLFFWEMIQNGVPKGIANLIYWGVRIGGTRAWRKHRRLRVVPNVLDGDNVLEHGVRGDNSVCDQPELGRERKGAAVSP